MKPKILITIEGGICQNVCTNFEADIVIVDYDSHSDEPVIVSDIISPDAVLGPDDKMSSLYSKTATDKDELFVLKRLKKLKF